MTEYPGDDSPIIWIALGLAIAVSFGVVWSEWLNFMFGGGK